jgi:hypothetical protein
VIQTFLYLFAIRKVGQQKHFSVKEKFGFVSRKIFFFYFGWKITSKLSCICLQLEKLVNGKTFPSTKNTFQSTENTFKSKENLVLFSGKYFPFILGGKHFPKVVKNLEMSYYLLIISHLVLKLLIAIYILF